MAGNENLHAANRAKQDEFYTQLPDIEKELKHYRKHFRGKTVYCNCDDPTISNFFLYFRWNFEKLGLKRLITTCYKNGQIEMFSNHDMEAAAGVEYVGNGTEPTRFQLKEDGDFRNRECIELLKQADIVVTNPPFSLFREYIAQLVEYDKKFVVIGSMNAITYKEVFPLIKSDRLWLGHGPAGKDMLFDVPEDYARELVRNKKEGSAYRLVDGVTKGRLGNAVWFTNLKYDNYDAINVNKTDHIPVDYAGEMGAPITFLDKHNPEQFEIIGMDRPLITQLTGKQSRFKIKGKEIFARIVIRNRRIQQ